MSNKLRNIFFVIGFSIFIYFVVDFGFQKILDNLYKTGWWFVAIIAVWGVVYLFNTFAWRRILKDEKNISFGELYLITVSGFAINYITPVINLGGEPYRILVLKEKIDSRRAVSSTILYSMLHFLSSFVFWILVVIITLIFIPLSNYLNLLMILFLILNVAIVFLFKSGHKKGIVNAFAALIKKISFLKSINKKIDDKQESLDHIDDQITELYNKRKGSFFISLSFEVIARIVAAVEFYMILKAIGYDAGFVDVIFIHGFSALVMNIFFFMPMELGARESGLYFAFDILKYPPALGIYVSVATRIREFFWILAGLLLIELNGRKFTGKKIKNVNYD